MQDPVTNHLYRTLTQEGEKELGHIFTNRMIPVTQLTPITDENGKQFFCLNHKILSVEIREKMIEYMTDKTGEDELKIRNFFIHTNFIPIQKKYVIESYDARFVI